MPDNVDIEARLIPEQGIQAQLDLVYLYDPEHISIAHDNTMVGDGSTRAPLGVKPDLFETFVFPFDASSTEWVIQHGLGKNPSITVVDSAGNVIACDRRYVDGNTVVILFNAPFKGTAYLN